MVEFKPIVYITYGQRIGEPTEIIGVYDNEEEAKMLKAELKTDYVYIGYKAYMQMISIEGKDYMKVKLKD